MKEELEKIANIWWTKDDARNALDLREIKLTDENIDTLWDAMDYYAERIEERMCEAGWTAVYDILEDLIRCGDIKEED